MLGRGKESEWVTIGGDSNDWVEHRELAKMQLISLVMSLTGFYGWLFEEWISRKGITSQGDTDTWLLNSPNQVASFWRSLNEGFKAA